MRITMLLLTATGLLMGCGSKRIASSTTAQPSANAAVVSEKKPAPVDKKAEKTAAKSEKKAEKASEKAVKASEKANDKAKANGKEKAAEKKAEKPAANKSEKVAEKNAEKASDKADKADKAVEKKSEKPTAAASGPRKLDVPPGHYPLPGECRVWFPGRPPGQQPRATVCKNLVGKVPAGAFLLYNEKHYDANYDWAAHAQRESWSVPRTVVQVLGSGSH